MSEAGRRLNGDYSISGDILARCVGRTYENAGERGDAVGKKEE